MPRARQIDVNPMGDRNYAVVVDGLLWCYAIREPRGMHGAAYTFRYHRGSSELHEDIRESKRGSPAVVWSDKHWLSTQGFYGSGGMAKHRAVHVGKYIPLQQRIADTAARLIRKKLILSPEERARQREAQATINLKRRQEFEAAARKRLDAKAKEVIDKFSTGDTVVYTDDRKRLGDLIVEAMEWARSNT